MKKFLTLFISSFILMTSAYAKDMRFVQITDTRYSAFSNKNTLEAVIEEVNKQKDIQFVVFTGDNINRAKREHLDAFLKAAKKLNCPFYVVIGDKDVNKQKEMSKKQYMQAVKKQVRRFKYTNPNYIFEKDGLVFMVADGAKDVIPGTNGYYKDNVIEWIDANLDVYRDKNVIILQHFPLIPPTDKDTYFTYRADEYLAMLHKHKNVKAIITGHFGVNKEQTVDGIVHISTAPSPNYRVIDVVDYDTANPVIWAEIKQVNK